MACGSSPGGTTRATDAATDEGARDSAIPPHDARNVADARNSTDAGPGDTRGSTDGARPTDASAPIDANVDPCTLATAAKTTVGCDFYAVDPDVVAGAQGGCFAAYLANPSSSPVTIQIEGQGKSYDAANFSYLASGDGNAITYAPLESGEIPPEKAAVVFLAGAPDAPLGACPPGVSVAYAMDGSVAGTGIGSAFHLTTSAPVAAYDIYPYGGGSAAVTGATLLIPTAAWDTTYLAIDAYRQSVAAASANAQPSMDVVAAEDGTEVTITPTVAIISGPGVAGTAAGTPRTYDLDKGQVLQISQPNELVGSTISSNKPVGHWAGASCLNVPVGAAACDAAHQQIPPLKALGHEYVAVRYRDRFAGMEESVPWRLVGAVDGSTLTYDPSAPAGAPLSLNAGQVVEFNSTGLFSVASQDAAHPFYMAAYMTGCSVVDPAEDDCRGDPEFVNVIPPQQFLSAYTFFTDPTFPETNLVFVRSKDATGFHDVTLDCAGTLGGWTPVGAGGNYEYARVDLMTGNFQGQNGCDNGIHEVHSSGPFGLTVWGWGSAATGTFASQAVSYAYPAGAGVAPINEVP
jgi:hypothetical protein